MNTITRRYGVDRRVSKIMTEVYLQIQTVLWPIHRPAGNPGAAVHEQQLLYLSLFPRSGCKRVGVPDWMRSRAASRAPVAATWPEREKGFHVARDA